MREKTYHIYLNEEERSQVIQSLIALKNNLAAQGRYTDAVDDVLCKVLGALKKSHLEYVIGCMERNTTKIANIKAYLITALYNAPNTIFKNR